MCKYITETFIVRTSQQNETDDLSQTVEFVEPENLRQSCYFGRNWSNVLKLLFNQKRETLLI